jgi:hypothetical protein
MRVVMAMLFIALPLIPLQAQDGAFEWNKKSTLSTERQIEFPGVVLEPGIYIVRVREAAEKRTFVEILNHDESQLLATTIAVADHRARPENNAEFTYHAVKNDPRPVQTWYFPGEMTGLEFVYAKSRAFEIAKDSDGHVMASNGNRDGAILAITPNGKVIEIDGEVRQAAREKPQ